MSGPHEADEPRPTPGTFRGDGRQVVVNAGLAARKAVSRKCRTRSAFLLQLSSI